MYSPVRCRWLLTLPLLLAAGSCGADSPPPAEAGATSDVLQAITTSVGGASVHRVRMTQHGDRYAFDPVELQVSSGDVVRFVMVGNQPESVVFDTAGLPPAQIAFIGSRGLDRGVLMIEPGSTFDANFAEAPAGDYPFRSVPHHEAGMKGILRVLPPE